MYFLSVDYFVTQWYPKILWSLFEGKKKIRNIHSIEYFSFRLFWGSIREKENKIPEVFLSSHMLAAWTNTLLDLVIHAPFAILISISFSSAFLTVQLPKRKSLPYRISAGLLNEIHAGYTEIVHTENKKGGKKTSVIFMKQIIFFVW